MDLVGPATRDQILEAQPEWQAVVAAYDPDPEAVARLKSLDHPVTVEVFLGTWCSDSRAHVSEFFKILDLVDSPLIIPSYVAVPRDKEARRPLTEGKDIWKVPTFIVSVDGREVGRIIETPAKSVERDLVDILFR
jgi:hypothetical protein